MLVVSSGFFLRHWSLFPFHELEKSFGCCESTANLSHAINKFAVDFKTSLIRDFERRDRILDPATRDTKQAKMVGISFPFKSLLLQNQTAFRALLTFQQVRTAHSKKRRFHGNQHSQKKPRRSSLILFAF